jgi:hypothetical protein
MGTSTSKLTHQVVLTIKNGIEALAPLPEPLSSVTPSVFAVKLPIYAGILPVSCS